MRTKLACLCVTLALALSASPVFAKGCLKGAFAGGVAGHYAHHHGLIGAAAGCAIGRHYANKHQREMQQQNGYR